MKILSHIPGWVRNKYFLTASFFIVWMIFFDMRDIASDYGRREKLKDLQKTERSLTQKIVETRKELDLLKTNAQTIEKYARDKYMMKKDNEEIFIMPPAEKSN